MGRLIANEVFKQNKTKIGYKNPYPYKVTPSIVQSKKTINKKPAIEKYFKIIEPKQVSIINEILSDDIKLITRPKLHSIEKYKYFKIIEPKQVSIINEILSDDVQLITRPKLHFIEKLAHSYFFSKYVTSSNLPLYKSFNDNLEDTELVCEKRDFKMTIENSLPNQWSPLSCLFDNLF